MGPHPLEEAVSKAAAAALQAKTGRRGGARPTRALQATTAVKTPVKTQPQAPIEKTTKTPVKTDASGQVSGGDEDGGRGTQRLVVGAETASRGWRLSDGARYVQTAL